MYLISIYFDPKTEGVMQSYINQVSKATGNSFMLAGKIPPHITLLALDLQNQQRVIDLLDENISKFNGQSVFFASIGAFKGQVLYVEPVLNEYLHNMSLELYNIYKDEPDIKFSPYYKPFGWLPHVSVGKHLDKQQMEKGFKVMLNQFVPVEGMVVSLGIAKTNPHRDIKIYSL